MTHGVHPNVGENSAPTCVTPQSKAGEMELLDEIPGWEAIPTPKGRTVYRPINGVISDADVSQRIDFCRDGMVAFFDAIGIEKQIRFGGDA